LARVKQGFCENTAARCAAETERAFQMSFISMLGNVKLLIGSISSRGCFHTSAIDGEHHEHGHPRTVS